VPQVVRVSPGRENGAKRSLGVWAPAASCGVIYSSPQVRDYQVCERSAPNTATANVSLTFCKNRIEGVKGEAGGAFAAHEAAKRLGCMRPPPVRLGQVSEKGGVNRGSTGRILSTKSGSS
jgi:hypothetical protein